MTEHAIFDTIGGAMTDETILVTALLDVIHAADTAETCWCLIGGQALIAHGVPRHTLDADALVPADDIEDLARALVEFHGWAPLEDDKSGHHYVEADEVTVHLMQDPVLFDVGEERMMIPLRSALGLTVELLAAQHPVERELVDFAPLGICAGVPVTLAPLGAVLLLKAKADRKKDQLAIIAVAEHLSAEELQEAVAWAAERDEATAEDLQSMLDDVAVRRRSTSKRAVRKKPKWRR